MATVFWILGVGSGLSLLGITLIVASLWQASRRGVPVLRGVWMPADRLTPRERRLNRGGFWLSLLGIAVLGVLVVVMLTQAARVS